MITKETLMELEDNAQEIRHNADGSVTFFFDEPGCDPVTGKDNGSSTTISKADYEAASKQ